MADALECIPQRQQPAGAGGADQMISQPIGIAGARLFGIGIAGVMLVATTILFAGTAAHAQAVQASGSQVCTYQSETYSDGAFVCAQRSLMQQCSVSGTSATWKIVTDKELGKLCIGPIARRETSRRTARLHNRLNRRAAAAATTVTDPQTSAKCFQFNGKRYCE